MEQGFFIQPTKSKDTIYKSLYFNSADRSFGTNNEPIFALNEPIKSTEKIKVLAANIPLSFYNFPSLNLAVNENTAGSAAITLNGNYTNSQLCSAIASGLTTASASTGNSLTYACDYSSILGKLTISATGGNFALSSSGTANNNLGFRAPSVVKASAQTSDSVVQLTKQYLVIQSDELSQSIATASRSYYNQDNNVPVAMVVPVLNGSFQYQYYESPVSSEYLKANTSVIERISFRIADLDNNPIDLNGVPWSIKIGVYTEPL